MAWLKENLIHILFYLLILAVSGFTLYKVFFQATTTTKNVYTQPVVQNHYNENPKYSPFSCARIIEDKK